MACQLKLRAESSQAINVQPICSQKQISIHRLLVSERAAQTYEYDSVGQVNEIEVMLLLLVDEPLLGSCGGKTGGTSSACALILRGRPSRRATHQKLLS